MNRDRITAAAVLAALVGLGVYVAYHTYWDDEIVRTPLQGEAATNEYYSLERLLHAVGIQTRRIASLRVLPPTTSALYANNLQTDVTHLTLDALEHWVQSGGRLVVTSLVDWQNIALQKWSGISPVDFASAPPRPMPSKSRQPVHAAEAPVEECQALAEKEHGRDTGATLRVCFLMQTLHSDRGADWSLENSDGLQLVRIAIGKGSLTVIGSPFMLDSRNFLREDDAQAFIDAVFLRRGDRLFILSESRAEPFIALLWRLAAPAVAFTMAAAILLILRHLPRFGPLAPVPPAARRSLAEQIRANARFAWRTGRLSPLREAARRALDRDAARTITAYQSLDTTARAAELGRLTGADPAVLDAAMNHRASEPPPVQRAAIVLLEQTRRALPLPSRHKGTP